MKVWNLGESYRGTVGCPRFASDGRCRPIIARASSSHCMNARTSGLFERRSVVSSSRAAAAALTFLFGVFLRPSHRLSSASASREP